MTERVPMADHFALRIVGIVLCLIGVGEVVVSGRHARRHADYLRSGRRKPRPYAVFPYDSPDNEWLVRWSMRISGMFAVAIGAIWIAG
jgi:uncharacterized protein YjeT (DUF2065 family)